jgi:multidrug efflux system membrane fusion protein
VAVFAFILTTFGCSSKTAAAPTRAAGGGGGGVPVVTKLVAQKDVPVIVQAIGNVEAAATINIQSQITGQLTEVHFREGDFVKKGDHLFTIDPRPFEAALAQAQANLTRDEALLEQSQAQLERDTAQATYMRMTADRNDQLNKTGIVSKDAVEQSRAAASAIDATLKADRAAVESNRAQLDSQKAAVDNSKLQLAYTIIRSPIDGRTGNLNVKAGNLVSANTTQLITIQQIEPVFVTFSVPAMHLPTIKHFMADGKLPVIATPQDADPKPVEGTLTFVDNSVDAATDTIRLKGTLPNADRRLWPGQFARVELRLTSLSDAIVVPSEAVQTGQDGQYVFVVKANSTVEQRPVEVGARVDQDVVIAKGLQPGETVVTEGQLRLEPGSKIQGGGKAEGGGQGGKSDGGKKS